MNKELTQEQRKLAQAMHKDFFDKIDLAIENGFYFEAYIREYNALEARVKVIMSILEMPCEICENTQLTNQIGIGIKINCLRAFIGESPIFEKTKLTKRFFKDLGKWTQVRNEAIHRLYFDPDNYETLSRRIKERSVIGKQYLRMIYNEADRLRRLKKRKPELFEANRLKCHINNETGELPDCCISTINYVKKGAQE